MSAEGNNQNVITMSPTQPIPAGEAIVKDKCELCEAAAVHKCNNCQKKICSKDTSNVDATLCVNCSPSVNINVFKESKKSEEYDEWNDEVTTHKHEAKHIQFTGDRWLSFAIEFGTLDEAKLKEVLEVHRGFVRQLELELTNRKIKTAKSLLAAQPLARRKVVTSVETTKTEKVRQKRITDPNEQIIQAMKKAGLDPKKLIEMLQQKVAAQNLQNIGKENVG